MSKDGIALNAYQILGGVAAVLLLLAFIRADALIIAVYAMVALYVILYAKAYLPCLSISTLMALAWLIVARDQYGYNQETISLFGITLFPLLLWSLELFAAYLVFKSTGIRNHRLPAFTAIFWAGLITVEVIAFHVLQIRNIQTGQYPGLPLCDCMHAPRWMQAAYLLMGPAYFTICQFAEKKFQKKK